MSKTGGAGSFGEIALIAVAAVFLLMPASGVFAPRDASAVPAAAAPSQVSPAGHNVTHSVPPRARLLVSGYLSLSNGSLQDRRNRTEDSLDPGFLVYDAAQRTVFVAGYSSANITEIGTVSNQITRFARFNNTTQGLGYDSHLNDLLVSRRACTDRFLEYCLATGNSLLVLGAGNLSQVARVPFGDTSLGSAVYDPAAGGDLLLLTAADRLVLINDTSFTVSTNTSVGTQPDSVIVDPSAGAVLVANNASNSVTVLNATSLSFQAQIPVGTAPAALAYDPLDRAVYVANAGSDNVSVLSSGLGSVETTIDLGFSPVSLAYDAHLGDILVGETNASGFGSLALVNASTDVLQATVTIGVDARGVYPQSMVVDPTDGTVYIANSDSFDVLVRTGASLSVGSRIPFLTLPTTMAFDSGTDQIFIADYWTGNVTVLSASDHAVVANVPDGDASGGMVYDSGTKEVFVANSFVNSVTVISDRSDSVVRNVTLPVNSTPVGLAYDPADGAIYVADSGTDLVAEINDTSDAVVATFPVGVDPDTLVYDPVHRELFVIGLNASNVSVVAASTDQVLRRISLGGQGGFSGSAVYDPRTAQVFVTSAGFGMVAVISTATDRVLREVSLPGTANPGGLAYDAQTSEVIVPVEQGVTPSTAAVGVLSDRSDRFVQWLNTGANPQDAVYDTVSHAVYVSNMYGGTLTLIDRATLEIRERGLPFYASWTVNVSAPGENQTASGNASNQTVLLFGEANGTVPFTVRNDVGSILARATGPTHPSQTDVAVNGFTVLRLTFGNPEPLTFQERNATVRLPGPPPGSLWSVFLEPAGAGGPPPVSNSSNNSTVYFTAGAGARYDFTVDPPSGYVAVPAHGVVRVGHDGASVHVRFRLLSEAPSPASPPSEFMSGSAVAWTSPTIPTQGQDPVPRAGITGPRPTADPRLHPVGCRAIPQGP